MNRRPGEFSTALRNSRARLGSNGSSVRGDFNSKLPSLSCSQSTSVGAKWLGRTGVSARGGGCTFIYNPLFQGRRSPRQEPGRMRTHPPSVRNQRAAAVLQWAKRLLGGNRRADLEHVPFFLRFPWYLRDRGLLCGLHPQRLRDRGELVADLLNAGGEFGGAADIDDLAGRR